MGLDMYLRSTEQFKSIKWTYTDEQIETNEDLKRMESGFLRTITLTTSDRTIELRNYEVQSIKLTNNLFSEVSEIKDITEDTITTSYWNEAQKKYEEVTINKSNIAEVTFNLAYWRKANQIHAWFVNEVQKGVDDCGEYKVTGKQLEALKELCKEVLEKNSNNFSSANLPTQAGFFFGSTGYDEYYYSDVKNTLEQLSNIKEDGIYSYHSSW